MSRVATIFNEGGVMVEKKRALANTLKNELNIACRLPCELRLCDEEEGTIRRKDGFN